MTDQEYASRIYCMVFQVEEDHGDVYVPGVFEALHTLAQRKQFALECYYRNGMTLNQTGEKLGVSGARARYIIHLTLRRLRSIPTMNLMSIEKRIQCCEEFKKLLQEKEKRIEEKNRKIEDLYRQIFGLLRGEPADRELLNAFSHEKTKIKEMDLSTRTYHALTKANITDCRDLLTFSSFDELINIHNIGQVAIVQIMQRLREYGYHELVDIMEERTSESLKRAIQEVRRNH